MPSNYTQERLETVNATILISTTTSDAINVTGKVLVGIITPSALTGSSFSIQVSYDGTTYKDYYNSAGTKITIAAAVDRHIGLVPADFAGAKLIKLVSGSSEAAERTIGLILRGM